MKQSNHIQAVRTEHHNPISSRQSQQNETVQPYPGSQNRTTQRGRPRYIRTGKPGRPRKEYHTANLSTQELLEAKYLTDSKHAEEALSGKYPYFWRKAMEEEFDSLIEQNLGIG
ncbi:hypothetical protein LAZ67_2003026 [Cordylochernes scorpioides]|uniref:Uncharacterized protein n=1 Tax=Cordylochernes scorpioides TaxID=51811 RepID=A0ABY6K2N2_9ARAC|nr:hypothetical protein LAZ67_2003026 [Cordylochernes scorpioides]